MPVPGPHAVKVTVALVACWLATSHACPASCICKWKSGKETVECVNRNLRGIPNGINPDTQVLDVSGNSIKNLSKDRFESLGLVNLQRIYMATCSISFIDDRAFSGLKNLVELDLSFNNLTAVPSATFTDYTSLMRLLMNGNQIKHIKTRAFHPLTSLTNLELSRCGIQTIDEDAFLGLDKLEWLKLDGNQITGMKGDTIFPRNIHGITLHNNPWICDCGMIDLRSWIASYKNPFDIDPSCYEPARLKGTQLKLLDENTLACLPEVSPTALFLDIAEGRNISLLCRVHAIPEARVSWWFQGSVLQNDTIIAPGVRLIYFIEEGTEDKKSELFIYNTNTDDNGTFTCIAENPAGRAQTNYTIRIIVREEPVVGMSSFPTEYVIAVAAGAVIVILVTCISIVACIIRCRQKKRRKRKEETSKVVALQSPQGKSSILVDANDRLTTMPTTGSKANGTVFISDRVGPNEMPNYADDRRDLGGKDGNGEQDDPYFSPNSNRTYNLEQNPDLINDAESVGKEKRLKGCDENNSYQEAMENTIDVQSQWHDVRYPVVVPTINHLHQQAQPPPADVHLSAGRFLDNDGYPIDYGLPKFPLPHPGMGTHLPLNPPQNMYRTLPHKSSRLHNAGQVRRFSREAEFLSRHHAYDHIHPPDVRYTVDGYPAVAAAYPLPEPPDPSDPAFLPSPPSAYKTDPFPGGSCCVPVPVPSPIPPPLRCSVGAQTTSCDEMKEACNPLMTLPPHHLSSQPLTESPDEGYEGEGAEAGDM